MSKLSLFNLQAFAKPSKRGYTLIELLITITITTILITFGVSAYRKASDVQAVKSQTELILTTLSQAQKAATTGKTDCTTKYIGEQVIVTGGTGNLTITSQCVGDSGTPKIVSLSDMTFVADATILFKPLNQGIDLNTTSPLNLDYQNQSDSYRIEVSQSGTIRSVGKL